MRRQTRNWSMLGAAALCAVVIMLVSSDSAFRSPERVRPISALSRAMQAEADRLLAEGQILGATGYYESALAADPRNVAAYIGLGQLARAQAMPGRAVRYYRAALAIDPDSRSALAGQGQALIARGAVQRARANFAKLERLCRDRTCPELATLSAALAAAGQRTALRAEEVLPKPVVEAAPRQR